MIVVFTYNPGLMVYGPWPETQEGIRRAEKWGSAWQALHSKRYQIMNVDGISNNLVIPVRNPGWAAMENLPSSNRGEG